MSQGGIDLIRLLSPACPRDEAVAGLEAIFRVPAVTRRAKKEKKRVAVSDIRSRTYLEPRGSIAWTLLGHRVIR